MTLWIYTALIRPMLTYGAVIWFPRVKLASCVTKLTHIQRMACLSVTGAMNTTPTAAMENMLYLPPLDIFIEEVALATMLRLRTVVYSEAGPHGGPRSRLWKEATKGMPILECPTDIFPPHYVFRRT